MSKLLKLTFAVLVLALPTLGWAQTKIAVVDLQEAILQTDVAQKRLEEIRNQAEFKTDKAEFERLKKEMDEMVKKFQKDAAVMSQEQQAAARQKLSSKQADLEHVVGKVQQTEQAAAQALLQELGPKVQEVLREIISCRWYRPVAAARRRDPRGRQLQHHRQGDRQAEPDGGEVITACFHWLNWRTVSVWSSAVKGTGHSPV